MKMQRITKFVLLVALGFTTNVFAHEQEQQLIQQWFEAMKAKQYNRMAEFLAPQFVSVHTDGKVRDLEQELELIKNLHMKSYNLTDFHFKDSEGIVTVTFKDTGSEKIDKKKIASGAALRMAVLQKQDGKWRIIAYANLDRIK